MPKHIPNDQLEAILAIVAVHPSGVRAATIHEGLESTLPPRMLQRRLALLVEQKRLIAEGRGRGRWYRLPGIVGELRVTEEGNDTAVAFGEVYPPISSDGAAIKQAVRASIQSRRPVGYNWAFLDAYRPNETFYLPAQTRQHFLEIGRSLNNQRPAGTYARHIYSWLLIDLSWNSSRLEGNTYSLLETERLLELGESAEGKDALEAQMILNHKASDIARYRLRPSEYTAWRGIWK